MNYFSKVCFKLLVFSCIFSIGFYVCDLEGQSKIVSTQLEYRQLKLKPGGDTTVLVSTELNQQQLFDACMCFILEHKTPETIIKGSCKEESSDYNFLKFSDYRLSKKAFWKGEVCEHGYAPVRTRWSNFKYQSCKAGIVNFQSFDSDDSTYMQFWLGNKSSSSHGGGLTHWIMIFQNSNVFIIADTFAENRYGKFVNPKIFSKKGEIRSIYKPSLLRSVPFLNLAYKNLPKYSKINNSALYQFNSYLDRVGWNKMKTDSMLRKRFLLDSIESAYKDSVDAERIMEKLFNDSINSLFTGIVVGENFYDGDHTIEIVKITSRGKDTLYRYQRNKETYYLQSGENDQYSILEKNGLNNNGENITGTYVKGRAAMGKVLVEEYGDDGMVHTSTKTVPRIIEIEPVVDENTPRFTKPSGIWTGKFIETKYRKNKIRGEWNVIVANNGIVRGVATSYYVRIKRGREYERTRTDEISGILSPNGKISLKTDDGAIFTGQIIGNSVSGKWVNGSNLGGSFSGKKENY